MHEIHCENLGISYNKKNVIENLNIKIIEQLLNFISNNVLQ